MKSTGTCVIGWITRAIMMFSRTQGSCHGNSCSGETILHSVASQLRGMAWQNYHFKGKFTHHDVIGFLLCFLTIEMYCLFVPRNRPLAPSSPRNVQDIHVKSCAAKWPQTAHLSVFQSLYFHIPFVFFISSFSSLPGLLFL